MLLLPGFSYNFFNKTKQGDSNELVCKRDLVHGEEKLESVDIKYSIKKEIEGLADYFRTELNVHLMDDTDLQLTKLQQKIVGDYFCISRRVGNQNCLIKEITDI